MEKDFQTEVIARLTKIETKLDDYNSVKTKADSAETRSIENEKEIKDIKEQIKWITRTIIAAIITGSVGILITIFKNGMGVS